MKYLAIIEEIFQTDGQVTNVDNYANQGLHLVYYRIKNEDRKALVLVYKDECGNSKLKVLLDDANINSARLLYYSIENEPQNITGSSNEVLENKVEYLQRENNDLAQHNKYLQQQMNIFNKMNEPEYNSTLEQTGGTFSEYFVLELTKILTQKA